MSRTRPQPKTLQVSRATARFLAAGHPWVRPDRFTRGLERLRPGDCVTLVDETGARLASALADPGAEIAARVFHKKPDMAFMPDAAIARALERRAALAAEADTDCYRLVHGEGDFLPGLRVERYGPVVVVVVLATCIAPHVAAITAALARHLPASTLVLREHTDDLRRQEVKTRRLDGRPLDPDEVVAARELGLTYPLRPFAGLATGLYVDQRETRVWLRRFAPGARVLNLFSYTGAFSLALLAAGAASALDVDLAQPALDRAAEAAHMNGLAARHAVLKAECRHFLATTTDAFDLVIVDPPTAAQGGTGWVLRRDYPEVLALALARLSPGGLLVAACNTLGRPYPLADALRDAAARARVAVSPVEPPPLGGDLPQIQGFPEGRPHRTIAVRVDRRA